jgi:hypothetical protein
LNTQTSQSELSLADSPSVSMGARLAETDPVVAVARMRLFLDLSEGVLERSDDGSGVFGEVFRRAGAELGRLWALLPGAIRWDWRASWPRGPAGRSRRRRVGPEPAVGRRTPGIRPSPARVRIAPAAWGKSRPPSVLGTNAQPQAMVGPHHRR